MQGTFNGTPGFCVCQQGMGWYTHLIFNSEAHFKAWIKRTRTRNVVGFTSAHGRCIRGTDYRGTPEDIDEGDEQMDTNASQAQAQQARTAKPAPAVSHLPGIDLKTIDLLARIASASEASLDALREMRVILGLISAKMETLIEAAEAAPATVASTGTPGETPAGNYRDYDAEVISVSSDDDGKPVYKIKGGPFTKFGVRVWPEVLPLLGVDVGDLRPGPNQFNARVRAVLDEKGQAKKVIGLAK